MKKRSLLFAIICITSFLYLFFFPEKALGFSINISPPSARLAIPPGDTESGTITVMNQSDSPIDMRAYIEDWVYKPDGSKEFLSPGTTPLSCAKWINIYPQKFHLEANSRLGVQYTISVPENATGGYYAVIFFQSIATDAEGEGNVMVQFAGRIGTIIYQETAGKTEKTGSIVTFECGRPDQNKPLEIKLALKNEGNTHIIAHGVLNVIDKDGNIFGRKDIGPINTFPGDTMEYKTEWLGELGEGTYDIIATLDTGLDAPLVAEITITVKSSVEVENLIVDASTNPPVLNVIIHNTGNLNARIEGKIDILNEMKRVVESITLKKSLVAPNSEKKIKAEAGKTLPAGEYRARAVVLFGNKELTKEETFFVK